MTIYRGKLTRIGDGTWKGGVTTASVLEIGDHSIRHVLVTDYMKTYLNDGLSQDSDIIIILNYYNEVVAIKNSGRIYNNLTPNGEITSGVLFVLLGIPFLLLFLVGAIGIILGAKMILSGLSWKSDWAELRNA